MVRYEALQGGRPFDVTVSVVPELKAPENYRLVGGHQPRVDLPAKIFGRPAFLHDLRPEGLLHARVIRPPNANSRLANADLDGFDAPGLVRTIVRGSFVAVVTAREEQAIAAATRIRGRLEWTLAPIDPPPAELHAFLEAQVTRRLLVVDGTPTDDPLPGPLGGEGVVSACYSRPYQMHGSIGPSAALAEVQGGVLRVWSHSQGPELLKRALAEVLGRPTEAVEVIHAEGAGCYGHNGADDAALDAALVAESVPGRPVLLKWTRADEHRWEPYAPPMRVRVRARLEAGRIVAWDQESISLPHGSRPVPVRGHSNLLAAWHLEQPLPPVPPQPARGSHAGIHRNADPIYRIGTKRIVKCFVPGGPLRASSTRGLGALANVFAIESFMDELADHAGIDPLEFRLAHLDDARSRVVLERLRDSLPPMPDHALTGRGFGFARYKNAQTWCAVAVDVRIDEAPPGIRLERAWIVADAGLAIDPDGLVNQLEGGFVQAASWTLKEWVRYDDTGVLSVDWASYPILTFSEVPEISTQIIDRRDQPALGAGEASTGPTAAAIANAIAKASGVRLRDLPLTPDKLVAAMLADD